MNNSRLASWSARSQGDGMALTHDVAGRQLPSPLNRACTRVGDGLLYTTGHNIVTIARGEWGGDSGERGLQELL